MAAVVERGVEPLLSYQVAEQWVPQEPLRAQIARPIGCWGPTRHKYLVRVRNDVDMLRLSQIPEDVVSIERPIVKCRYVVPGNSGKVEKDRSPAQAVQDDAVLPRHAPPNG